MHFLIRETLSFNLIYVAACYLVGTGMCHNMVGLLQHYISQATVCPMRTENTTVTETEQHIEDIFLFEVNIRYISVSVLKTSEFSRVHSSRDEIYLVLTEKSNFSLYFILFIGYMQYLTY